MRRTGYQNAVLTAIAVLLALGLIDRRSGGGIVELASAQAQPGDPDHGGMTNELEQNKQIIAELRLMNGKLERLESKISAGLSVKVTSMPAIQANEAGGKKNKEAAANAKPEVGK